MMLVKPDDVRVVRRPAVDFFGFGEFSDKELVYQLFLNLKEKQFVRTHRCEDCSRFAFCCLSGIPFSECFC